MNECEFSVRSANCVVFVRCTTRESGWNLSLCHQSAKPVPSSELDVPAEQGLESASDCTQKRHLSRKCRTTRTLKFSDQTLALWFCN